MRCAGEDLHGERARALIVILWRSGLRIQEALSLTELDLDPRRGSVLVRRGKGARRRKSGWTSGVRAHPAVAGRSPRDARRVFCVVDGRTRGRSWSAPAPRGAAPARGPRRRPPPLRAAPAPARARLRFSNIHRVHEAVAADRHPGPPLSGGDPLPEERYEGGGRRGEDRLSTSTPRCSRPSCGRARPPTIRAAQRPSPATHCPNPGLRAVLEEAIGVEPADQAAAPQWAILAGETV